MTTAQEFVDEVTSYRGVKFRHMGRSKVTGVDCVGLVVASMRSVGIAVEDMAQYPRFPINEIFSGMIDKQTVAVTVDSIRLGDLLKFKWTVEPQHIAVVTEVNPLRITHAYSQVGAVVTNDLDTHWMRLFTEARRIPGLA
jgi:cell wall-associated NlpC family hydrolase